MKSTNHSKVSVVVVNYNRADLLRMCLDSLNRQTYRDFEVIVVDNGSVDSSAHMSMRYPSSRFSWIQLDSNIGFSAGCNRGIQDSSAPFIALLNNDAVASAEWLAELMKVAQQTPACGMWASKILFFDSEVIDKTGHLIYWDGQNRGRGTGERDVGQYDDQKEILLPDGCAALYRTEALLQAGGFDPEFFAYADDADLGLRIRWQGWKCLYVPEALVHHRHSSTLGGFSEEKIFLVERNRFWLVLKDFPLVLLILSPLFTLNRWAWNLAAAVMGRGPAGNYRKKASTCSLVKTLVKAYVDGISGLGDVISRRKIVFGNRKLSTREFLSLIWKFKISARQLAFQDRQLSSKKRE